MYDLTEDSAIVVLSGGLDSTAALYAAAAEGYYIAAAVSFNYGQKHSKELDYAANTCHKIGIFHHIVDLSMLSDHLGVVSSLIAGGADIPEGHYAEDNMTSTVVPNRNMMMISIAASFMPKYRADTLVLGMHGGDHFIYPDCTEEFLKAAFLALVQSFDNTNLQFYAPFIQGDKQLAASVGYNSGMVFEDTWSCYVGGKNHCGRCGTCVERLQAISDAGLAEHDTTIYDDSEFWKTAVANHNNNNGGN